MILSSFKMAQKSIISFFGKTSSSEETNVEASSPQEADIPSSEHSSGPQKKKQKFEHVYGHSAISFSNEPHFTEAGY